jgi:hypothetical protein
MSGNIFTDTTKINHTDIPTLITTLTNILDIDVIPVGSSAAPIKGAASGDIDVMVDEQSILNMFNVSDPKTGRKELYNYLVSKGLTAAQSGSIVHTQLPLNNQLHQIDIMVTANADRISKFHIHKIPKNSPYKGVNKHLLISLLAKEKGYLWSPWQGLYLRTDGKKGNFVSNDITEIANILLNSSESSLNSVESILAALPKEKATELLFTAKQDPNWVEKVKPQGRTFNHLEDLVFFYGSDGAKEAVEHLIDLSTVEGAESIRIKWDGCVQIYWGRETENGPLIFCNHNAWLRNIKTSSPLEIRDFIANNSGTQSPERTRFANKFARLYSIFDAATPKDFVGFVYADAIYIEHPEWDLISFDEYQFSPNPHSNTTYSIDVTSDLGDRVSQSTALVVGHAYYSYFSQDEASQQPLTDFTAFNTTKELIVYNPVYVPNPVIISEVFVLKDLLSEFGPPIDRFVNSNVQGLSDLKNIMYSYFNQIAKKQELHMASANHFLEWLATSKVSATKQQKIHTLHFLVPYGLEYTLYLTYKIQFLKNRIIKTLEWQYYTEIRITNGEGYVRYADSTKKFGHIKLVPRHKWFPK